MKRLFNRTHQDTSANWRILFLLVFLFSTGCAGPVEDNLDATRQFSDALLTATFALQPAEPEMTGTPSPEPSPTSSPTHIPEPTFTASPTTYSGPAPTLPAEFSSDLLRGGTVPQSYIEDTCTYLQARLDPNNSLPGTVVMPVMFHGIVEDSQQISDPMNVHHADMVAFIERAVELGFETITTQELVDFLETNAPIPPLSMIIILDDRRPGGVREHFMPYLEQYGWSLTLAWLTSDMENKPASFLECCPWEEYKTLWEQMEAYNATGYLDVQSHGHIHNTPISEFVKEEYIISELSQSRQLIQEHFYCKDYDTGLPVENCETDQPLAFIWPGGGFTPRAAELARQNGYRIAFTTNPRGPIMYNWIPQASAYDPATPSWLPEGPVGNPLMTLPRYWSYDAVYRIEDVFQIAQKARENAENSHQAELNYYQVNCLASHGEIPAKEVD